MKGKLFELRFIGKPQLKPLSFGEKFYVVFSNYCVFEICLILTEESEGVQLSQHHAGGRKNLLAMDQHCSFPKAVKCVLSKSRDEACAKGTAF